MLIFGDVETTGINPMCDEVITGYFKKYSGGKFVGDYHLESQVNNWSDEAEIIHGITHKQSIGFKTKSEAWSGFSSWIPPSRFTFCCFANTNTQLGSITFDYAIIRNELMLLSGNSRLEQCGFNCDLINVYNIAKESEKNGLFSAYINPKTNRKSFSQVNIYKALFNESYNAHDAKEDVNAMIRIYFKLIELQKNETKVGSLI